jgi:hypothetical protein
MDISYLILILFIVTLTRDLYKGGKEVKRRTRIRRIRSRRGLH